MSMSMSKSNKTMVGSWNSRDYKRSATTGSLRNFRATTFHDRREARGGAVNANRDILDELYLEYGEEG